MNPLQRLIRFYYTASHLPECLAPLMDLGLSRGNWSVDAVLEKALGKLA